AADAPENVPPAVAALIDPGKDVLFNRSYISRRETPLGEVRLLKRGEDAAVVQTLLYTSMLRRVVGEIGKKEKANWPSSQPGHEDSARYMDALTEAQRVLWSRIPRDEQKKDGLRQNLLIE